MNKQKLLKQAEHLAGLAWKVVGAVTVTTFVQVLRSKRFSEMPPSRSDHVGSGSYWLAALTGAFHAAEASARKAGAGLLG